MTRRDALARALVLVWATFQLLAPGATSIAHGLSSLESSAAPVHVEATGSASCPEVHAPGCGVCRYLTSCSDRPGHGPIVAVMPARLTLPFALEAGHPSVATVLPPGRAPPTL